MGIEYVTKLTLNYRYLTKTTSCKITIKHRISCREHTKHQRVLGNVRNTNAFVVVFFPLETVRVILWLKQILLSDLTLIYQPLKYGKSRKVDGANIPAEIYVQDVD